MNKITILSGAALLAVAGAALAQPPAAGGPRRDRDADVTRAAGDRAQRPDVRAARRQQ